MTQFTKKLLELFLHLVAAVVSADGDQLRSLRTAPRHAANKLDFLFADDISRQRRQSRALSDAQHGAVIKVANVVLGDYGL